MAAMHEELKRIVTLLDKVEKQQIGRKQVFLGFLNKQKVVVVFSGWGKVAAATTSTMLIERYSITQLIFTGVAGAIASHVNVGDIVIGSTYVQHDMDCAGVLGIKRFEIPLLALTEIPADKALQNKSIKAVNTYLAEDLNTGIQEKELKQLGIKVPSVHCGLIASGDQFIGTKDDQVKLLAALPSLLAVEMEGAAVAQVAYEYELPFVVIRIISDKADDNSVIDFPRFIENVASRFTAGIIGRLVS